MEKVNNKELMTNLEQKLQEQKPKNRTVWVVPNRTPLPRETMKSDSFGYDDWEIYHGA